MNSKEIGNLGEEIACNYLQKKGYKILEKNYSPQFISGPNIGEIDIVAEKEKTLSFIEVKTLICNSLRSKNSREWASVIFPEDKVNLKKQRKIIKTAQSYFLENKYPLDTKWQIDVLAIEIDLGRRKARIRYIENAFGG